MNVRKILALLLSFVTLFALLAGGAGALPMPPAHHAPGLGHPHADLPHAAPSDAAPSDAAPSHADHDADHDAGAHATSRIDLAGAATDVATDCAQSRHACCPGLAATLPAPPALPRFERGGEPIGFRSGLRLIARADGIFRPPRRIS